MGNSVGVSKPKKKPTPDAHLIFGGDIDVIARDFGDTTCPHIVRDLFDEILKRRTLVLLGQE